MPGVEGKRAGAERDQHRQSDEKQSGKTERDKHLIFIWEPPKDVFDSNNRLLTIKPRTRTIEDSVEKRKKQKREQGEEAKRDTFRSHAIPDRWGEKGREGRLAKR